MPVNLTLPQAAQLRAVAGVDIGYAEAGIRKAGRKDILVLRFAAGSEVAGVFTQNRFCAAPVTLVRTRPPNRPCRPNWRSRQRPPATLRTRS